ncbi:MAG: hypothetical protein IPJ20_24140 [Flammeovirgaceae bacterium]|nr:hypothetical protein [Flammeovirgaceae bacterium]
MNEAIAIFGQGNAVNIIKVATWLSEKEILYWGDIDVQGLKYSPDYVTIFANVKSVLMDELTFNKFFENDLGTPTNISTELNLTYEEHQLYNILKRTTGDLNKRGAI